MDKFKLITQHSLWFIPLCLVLATLYAFILYKKKSPWNNKVNNLLASLRFVLIFLLAMLLLEPLIRHIKNYVEKPTVVLAIDNSQSLKYSGDSTALNAQKKSLHELAEKLSDEGINVSIQTLEKTGNAALIKNLNFDNPSTNLSQLLSDIQSNYENRNLSGVVLLSDGIYNQGIAPQFNQYGFNIYPIGVGDTVPKKDINLKNLQYNHITYTGNKFPIIAEIHNKGFSGESVQVSLKQNGKILEKKTLQFSSESSLKEIAFQLSSDQKGRQHYVVEVAPLQSEFTAKNNIAHAYIDILEGKEKILLVAGSPHPDIKALKSAIEKKENYELKTYIPGISDFKEDKYDLVIFHQLPDYSNTARNLIEKYSKNDGSVLFILGLQTSFIDFNSINGIVNISARRGQIDNVTPSYNSTFEKFKMEVSEQNIMDKYPPVKAPFGNFSMLAGAETDVILYQKIGSVVSTKPLLMLSSKNGKKTGVFAGEGIWEWRLQEYSQTKDTRVFDKFISNLIQYLSSKEDKRKFRLSPLSNEFLVSDPVLFEAETYNDVYEKIYGQKIDLKLKDEKGNATTYSFVNGENNSRFEVKGLKQGIYQYEAACLMAGKLEKVKGEFTIRELNLEALNTTADHDLLRQLAQQTKGQFFLPSQINRVADVIKKNNSQSIIHSNEEFIELVNLNWIFFLFLLLASLEWFLRKYKGGY